MTETKEPTEPATAESKETGSKDPPKQKVETVMDAASALTSLQEEENGSRPTTPPKPAENDSKKEKTEDKEEEINADDDPNSPKRFLPDHKKPDAAPTFPEKLMSMMRYVKEQDEGFCIQWCEDGKSFIIRNPDDFTRQVVPKFFKATKFSSFTRKLYRWGFRQINRGIGPDDPIIFGNEFFQRDDESMIAKMRSVTAASTRKAEQSRMAMMGGMKRPYDDPFDEDSQKRMLFDQLLQQQKQINMMTQNGGFYGGMNPNGSLPLTNALRPSLGLGTMHGNGMAPMGNPNMMMHPGPDQNGNMMMPQMNQMNMGQYMPPQQQQQMPQQQMPQQQMPNQMGNPQQQQPNQMGNQQQFNSNGQYPNPQSTAEIVNAAIAALRHAN